MHNWKGWWPHYTPALEWLILSFSITREYSMKLIIVRLEYIEAAVLTLGSFGCKFRSEWGLQNRVDLELQSDSWIPVQLDFSRKFLMFLWPPKKHAKSYQKVGNLNWSLKLQIQKSTQRRCFYKATNAYQIRKERVLFCWTFSSDLIRSSATERALCVYTALWCIYRH